MVSKELLSLADMAGAQVHCIHKLTKVVIVNRNKDLIFVVLRVVAPSLEDLNNNQ